jgi:uncharacterized protein
MRFLTPKNRFKVAVSTLCDLPDVNVWLALLNSQHPHHGIAKAYWESGSSPQIAFCRITMLGLLRLSTHKIVMGGSPYTGAQAWQAYQAVIDLPEVCSLPEPPGIDAALRSLTLASKSKTPDWTDAYLAAFATVSGLRMVSLDKGFAQYKGLSLLLLSPE